MAMYELDRQSFRKGYGGFWYDNTGDYFVLKSDSIKEIWNEVHDCISRDPKENYTIWKLDEDENPLEVVYAYIKFEKSLRPDASDEAFQCLAEATTEENPTFCDQARKLTSED